MNEQVEVHIRRGVPGLSLPDLPPGSHPYPDTAVDFAKIAREAGLTVTFQDADRKDRVYLTHNAADCWLPSIVIGAESLIAIGSGLATHLVIQYLRGISDRQVFLHLECTVTHADGSTETTLLEGPRETVLESLREFEVRNIEQARGGSAEAGHPDEQSG
ncbi:hypothetical protein GCM10009836_59630 [Pseudonocardia ailaonensis]|uniref:Uncharacterized protein n=1 Tax=Pseudonocardia ailaonensis TaxID=367279 RepID=A0ABN2NIP2_9PSEU